MNPDLFLPPQSTLLRLFKGQAKMSDELPQALNGHVFFFERALDTVDGRNSPTTTWDV